MSTRIAPWTRDIRQYRQTADAGIHSLSPITERNPVSPFSRFNAEWLFLRCNHSCGTNRAYGQRIA